MFWAAPERRISRQGVVSARGAGPMSIARSTPPPNRTFPARHFPGTSQRAQDWYGAQASGWPPERPRFELIGCAPRPAKLTHP